MAIDPLTLARQRRERASMGLDRASARTYRENKISMYLATDVIREIRAEAKRTDRSISWLMQFAWRRVRDEVKELATVEEDTCPPPQQ